ncbi:interferon gamma receptor 2 isoform X2 [Etheostoma cragini]|uniref:interferon gamma receptor 2 isoform X2 n=1 Tax=Etheostoma cragini TaxID=417921 RepID=UPI00155F4CF6|nr:interferon gamma receptor 2 isoform X2 [Etheostoma cragini]
MPFSVLFMLVFVQALSASPPAPPQNIHVSNWLLTWTPSTEEGDPTYTVQYSSFSSGVWTNVPSCVHMSSNSCNVTSTKAEGEHGCVMLRVQAERGGRTSTSVKACSRHGDSCTPDFSLTPRSGSLTVNLSSNHSLALEYAAHAKHRVYYGKEGEPLLKYKDAVASVTISELQEGQRYCVQVQYLYFRNPVGLATCTQCELIPESKKEGQTVIIAVVLIVVLVCLIPGVAYFLIFKTERIKQCLQPSYNLPENFLPEPFSEHHLSIYSSSPTEECWDVISSISCQELSN